MKTLRISLVLLLLPLLCAFTFPQNGGVNAISPGQGYTGIGPQSPFNPLATDPPKIYGSDGTYYGEYSASPLGPDSINNPVGRYGNPMSPDSLLNPYNTFGAPMPRVGAGNEQMWPVR